MSVFRIFEQCVHRSTIILLCMYHIKTSNTSETLQLVSLLFKPYHIKLTTILPSDVLVSRFIEVIESIIGLQSACFSMQYVDQGEIQIKVLGCFQLLAFDIHKKSYKIDGKGCIGQTVLKKESRTKGAYCLTCHIYIS